MSCADASVNGTFSCFCERFSHNIKIIQIEQGESCKVHVDLTHMYICNGLLNDTMHYQISHNNLCRQKGASWHLQMMF